MLAATAKMNGSIMHPFLPRVWNSGYISLLVRILYFKLSLEIILLFWVVSTQQKILNLSIPRRTTEK